MKEKRDFLGKVNDFAIVGGNVIKVMTSALCLVYVSVLIGLTLADSKKLAKSVRSKSGEMK